MKRSNVCDTRICIRLPKPLAERIAKECDKNDTQLSSWVRGVLVNALSAGMR